MKSINSGIFHDSEDLLGILGKKGTASDILFSNRKEGDTLYAFMEPKDDKLSVKCEIMQIVDAAIIRIDALTPAVGETILLLDALGKRDGILIIADSVDRSMLSRVMKDTVVSGYREAKSDFNEIMGILNSFDIKRNDSAKPIVDVDHFFNVKGVGTVILGFVRRGEIKKYDKMKMLPSGKEIIVRSIQMHDKDFDSAGSGCRVGIAIKGADAEEFSRGAILCAEGAAEVADTIKMAFSGNRFYSGGIAEGKKFHLSIGMQFLPVSIKSVSDGTLELSAEKKCAISHKERALLVDLNAPKLRLAGAGTLL